MTTDFRALCAELVQAFKDLRDFSHGVFGLHLNGDLAPWDELIEGGRFEDWLEVFARARTALADEPAPEGREPVSFTGRFTFPADGEVAELVTWLQEIGETIKPNHLAEHQRYKRAADLLQRLSPPQPVPVSERLPEAKDCDDQKRCWWLVHQSWPCLYLMKADSGLAAAVATHWLPAHALPLPEAE